MTEPMRVLQVMATLDRGGAEAVVMEWLRRLDRTRVILDFVVNEGGPYSFEQEAIEFGSRVFKAPKFRGWNAVAYALWWRRFMKDHPEWSIVHAHHTLPAFIFLGIARGLGRVTVAHSHIAGMDRSLSGVIRAILRWPLRFIAEIRLAPTKMAATWMFGRRASVRVIPNGIDAARYASAPDNRERIRREFGWEDAFIVGHVGRFSRQKNHARLLRVFASLLQMEPRARLLVVGDGDLRGEIEKDVQALGLEDKVLLVGVRTDVPALLAAMDVLLFPSLYEGLGVALVEAQASGLPCVASDAVPSDARITDLLTFLPLSANDSVWARTLLNGSEAAERASRVEEIHAAGYDSADVALEIQRLYLSLNNEEIATS